MAKKPQLNSKIIRVSNETLAKLEKFKGEKGGWNGALEAALTDAYKRPSWALPGQLYKTRAQARAQAMKNAVLQDLSLEEAEQPLKVRKS
jgi:hypothetical protein